MNKKIFSPYRIFSWIICLILIGLTPCCRRFTDITPPRNSLSASNVFADEISARSAVAGIYNMISASLNVRALNCGVTIYMGLSADELVPTNPNINIGEINGNAILPTNSTAGSLWSQIYDIVYLVNNVIIGVEGSKSIGASDKELITAEMKFLRALCFFYLVNIYGDVPLPLGTDYRVNMQIQRSSVSQVYEQIKSDLLAAESKLSDTYMSAFRGRPNRATVKALLSRVYLYLGDWAAAETKATDLIGHGAYFLEPQVENVFLNGSPETIWQLAPTRDMFNTNEAAEFLGSSNTPKYYIDTLLYNSFEPGDRRSANWILTRTVNAKTYRIPYKYKKRYDAVVEHYIMFRLGEQFFIRAEARAQQNKLMEAKQDVDSIRTRAGLPLLPDPATKEECLLAIQKEKRVEFFSEWGHRWFDLRRWQLSEAILGPIKSGWQNTDQLFPVPESEITANSALTQNEGY